MAITPDVGSIKRESNTGAAPQIDVFGEVKSVAQNVTKMGEEIVVGNTNKKVDEKLDEIVAEDAAKAAEPLDEPIFDDSAEGVVMAEAHRLATAAGQLGGSQRDRIELALRKLIADAADKHPQLKARLRAELGFFMENDPEFNAVLQTDARDAEARARAGKDLDRMQDYAYQKLGMSPSEHRFGDEYFAKEYVKREKHHQGKITNDQQLDYMESQQNLAFDDYAVSYRKSMEGSASGMQDAYDHMAEGLKIIQTAMRDPSSARNQQIMSDWEFGGRAEAMRGIAQARFELAENFDVFPSDYYDNEKYKSLMAAHKEQLAAYDTLIGALADNDPGGVEQWAAYNVYKLMEFESDYPKLANQLRLLNEAAPGLEAASAAFDGMGDIIMHRVAKGLGTSLGDLFGRDMGFAQFDGIPPGATVEQLTAHYGAVMGQNPDPYNTGMTTPEDLQASAVADSKLKHTVEYLDLALDEAMGPDLVAAMWQAEGVRANQYLTTGQFATDGARDMILVYADPKNLEVAQKANTSQQPHAVEATMVQISALSNKYNDARIKDLEADLAQSVGRGGLTLGKSILSIDGELLEKEGKVRFEVDRQAVMAATPAAAKVYVGQKEQNYRAAVQKANELAIKVSQQLQAYANIMAMWDQSFEPDYLATWNSGFANTIGEISDGEVQ